VRRRRDWFGAGAAVVLVVAVVPPLEPDARRYVLAEAIQFALVALAFPALLALASPVEWLATRWDESRLARVSARRDTIRTARRGLTRLLARVVAFVAAVIVWRLPLAVDALARSPGLIAAEIATFAAVGVALYAELVQSPPLPPIVTAGQRIVPCAVSMWVIWILAYLVGFSHSVWYPAVHPTRPGLSVVADQELATGCLWLAAAAAFLPVIFTNLVRFLRGDDEVHDEVARIVDTRGQPSAS
jgi:cytochrome c oxidase assembly factor CtaG